MAVGEIYKKRFPQGNLFFIQAGLEQRKVKIEEIGRVYELPWPFLSRRNFKEPVHVPGIRAADRGQRCLDIISQEDPDLMITEFFPLGREESRFELLPALVKASSQGARLWSVAGYPLVTGSDGDWRDKVMSLYDQVFIFTPPIEKDLIREVLLRKNEKQQHIEFFERNASKIIFTGYVLPEQTVVYDDRDQNLVTPPTPSNACHITVVRGGGAYYTKLIAEAILASDVLGRDYYVTVVAGPSTTSQEWYLFSVLMSKKKVPNVVLLRSAANYETLIAKSDVCVSVASYHTSVMLLRHRKKAVVVPFEGPAHMTFSEQAARANLLKDLLGAKVLSMDDLTADRLATTINEVASSSQSVSPVEESWFKGGEVFAKALEQILDK